MQLLAPNGTNRRGSRSHALGPSKEPFFFFSLHRRLPSAFSLARRLRLATLSASEPASRRPGFGQRSAVALLGRDDADAPKNIGTGSLRPRFFELRPLRTG
ncbi:hypothetical protein MTO96_001390 [Rhipicephalus appendiculatus]